MPEGQNYPVGCGRVFRYDHQSMKFRFIILIFLLALIVSPAGYAATLVGDAVAVHADLSPHRALYRINMVGKRSGASVLNVSGRMMFEWKPDCSAWLTDHRLNVVYDYTDSPAIRVKSDFSTYEPFDGRSMHFSVQKRRNGVLFQELRGSADLDKGAAKYSVPHDLSYDLSPDVLFPVSHTLKVLDKMRAGERFYEASVFDGSDETGPVLINAFLGASFDPETLDLSDTKIDQSLLDSPARLVRLAFFPAGDKTASVPEYEMNVVLHENGVISDMIIEYEDFTVEQKLVALDKQDNTCVTKAKTSQ